MPGMMERGKPPPEMEFQDSLPPYEEGNGVFSPLSPMDAPIVTPGMPTMAMPTMAMPVPQVTPPTQPSQV